METKEIDFSKLNEALEKFGSLQEAVNHLEKGKLALEKKNKQLKQETEKLEATRDEFKSQIEEMSAKIKSYQSRLESLYQKIKVHSNQYELFCGFMAMVTESPSVTDSITTLIEALQKLKDSGWHLSKSAADMRSLFVRTVMGDYLKCFRCEACDTKFIANSKPKYKLFGNGYQCPVCHNWNAVKEDDSFLKALVSEQQLNNIQQMEKVLAENELLEPFKAFLGVPCEMCKEPVKEWDDQNVKLVIDGLGWGHTRCWNSASGQLSLLLNSFEGKLKARKNPN